MSTDNLLQLVLRLLPAIAVFVLAFVAASDRRSRDQWTNLLYQIGNIRSEQRSDPKIQGGVKWPFFLVAVLLLIWPINYYRHATRVFEISPDAYGSGAGTRTEQFNPYGSKAAPGQAVPSGAAPGTTSPTPASSNFNPYGSGGQR